MTCIVGIEDPYGTLLGVDSSASSQIITDQGSHKIFYNGPFLFGCTSSFRMIDLLNYSLKVDEQFPLPTQSNEDYMKTTFIDAVRKCFKKGGFSENQNEVETGGQFIVVYKNKLYHIYEDYCVLNASSFGVAAGTGHELALGSLYTTDKLNLPYIKRIELALEAAIELCSSVKGPIIIKRYESNI